MILKSVEQSLSKAGYNVLTAPNGLTAIDLFENNKLDAVITDLMMPEASGIDLIKNVRTTNADVPILVMSTVSNETVIVEVLNIGADDYLRKPFIPKELLQRLEHIFSKNEVKIYSDPR
jgi:DNA-binding response OmpR family regulator